MLKKITVFFILLLICTAVLSAEDRKVLAVPTIEARGVSSSVATTCRNILETALIKTGAWSVINYSDVEEILEAQAFSLSGCTDDSCAIEIGELLAAEKIIVGSIDGLGDAMVLTVRLIDVEKGTIESAEIVNIAGLEDLQRQSFTAAYGISGLKYIAGSDSAVKEKGAVYVSAPEGMVLDVSLDGRPRGSTPLMITEVDFGVHLLSAEAGGYSFSTELSINSADITEICADNTLLCGNLLVQIQPETASGFEINLGDLPIAPGLNRNLSIGTHPLKLRGGFWYYDGEAVIEDGRTTAVSIEVERRALLSLSLPEGAEASLLSPEDAPALPLTAETLVPPGEWELVVEHGDYETYRQAVTATAGERIDLSPLLTHTRLYADRARLAALQAERDAAAELRDGFMSGAIVSACVTAAGGIAAGVFEALIAGETAALESNYASYRAATLSSEAEAFRTAAEDNQASIDEFRIIRNISLITAGTGILAGSSLLILSPDTAELDAQIARLSEGVNK